jgi:hypothetical protein
MELLKEKNKKLLTKTGFVRGKESVEKQIIDYDFNWGWKFRTVRTITTSYRGATKLYPSALKPEMDWGITPFDVVLALWEIKKLSFVIDWFWSVGKCLGAYRPGGAEIAHQSNTLIYDQRIKNVSRMTYSFIESTGSLVYNPEITEEKINIIKRSTDITKPILPVFTEEALSLVRQIDAVALLFVFLKAFAKRR